ncbi:MAG TPA: SPFH domain-containing protein, partial [Kofleriaceae bacterium]|nr:SPFH domain-containing protein [Kofleriaceae bacterium]
MLKERSRNGLPGLPLVLFLLALAGAAAVGLARAHHQPAPTAAGIVGLAVVGFCLLGFFIVSPNEGRVLQLFGKYLGTCRTEGLRWVFPFITRRSVSLRVRSFESQKLKVNDLEGNPIEIAAVVVWKVVDTAHACFQVDNVDGFVRTQAESAVRNTATHFAYDSHEEDQLSLRGSTDAIADKLKRDIQERLAAAGISVVEARISHLAYAPEIAQAMLQRLQATAIIAARTK